MDKYEYMKLQAEMQPSQEHLEKVFNEAFGKNQIESSFKCHKCGKRGSKTDGECKVWCEGCLGMEICPPVKRSEPKIQRNEPCPCGSNLKYKKCCGHGNKN